MDTKDLELKKGEFELFYGSLMNMSEVKLPLKFSNIILETISNIEPDLKIIATHRDEIIQKYCKRDSIGPILKKGENGREEYDFETEEDRLKCGQEVKELMDVPITIKVKVITLEEIQEMENIKPPVLITPAQADILWVFTNKTN